MSDDAVGQVGVVQEEPAPALVRVVVEVVDPPGRERARAADQAVDLVALVEQELGEVRAVLAGDAGDERGPGLAQRVPASGGKVRNDVPRFECLDRSVRRWPVSHCGRRHRPMPRHAT